MISETLRLVDSEILGTTVVSRGLRAVLTFIAESPAAGELLFASYHLLFEFHPSFTFWLTYALIISEPPLIYAAKRKECLRLFTHPPICDDAN